MYELGNRRIVGTLMENTHNYNLDSNKNHYKSHCLSMMNANIQAFPQT